MEEAVKQLKNKNKKTLVISKGLFVKQSGQAVLEFALVLPVLLLLLFGMLTFGFWMYEKLILMRAVDAAIRELVLTNNNEAALNAGKMAVGLLPNPASAEFIFTPKYPMDSQRKPGGLVTVVVHYPSPFVFFPFAEDASALLSSLSEITVSATARMECDPVHSINAIGALCPPLR